MKITRNISFENFKQNYSLSKKRIELDLKKINNEIINSLKPTYKYSYSKKLLKKYEKKFSILRLIGMGGSILGTKAIFSFLKDKIKKKIIFFDNLSSNFKVNQEKKILNIIVSKS